MHANRSEREIKCAWRWNEKDVERPFCSVLMMDAAMVLCGVRLPNKKVSERDHIFLHPFFRYPLSRENFCRAFVACVCWKVLLVSRPLNFTVSGSNFTNGTLSHSNLQASVRI